MYDFKCGPYLKEKGKFYFPFRVRLISKGIVLSSGYGEIDFTVPLFDEYLRRINPELRVDAK